MLFPWHSCIDGLSYSSTFPMVSTSYPESACMTAQVCLRFFDMDIVLSFRHHVFHWAFFMCLAISLETATHSSLFGTISRCRRFLCRWSEPSSLIVSQENWLAMTASMNVRPGAFIQAPLRTIYVFLSDLSLSHVKISGPLAKFSQKMRCALRLPHRW